MTTPITRRRSRRRRPAAPTASAPAAPVRAGWPPAPTRPGRTECCRTWSSEHLTPGGVVVRTTWHEPACPAWARR
ncbi:MULTISPECIES: hypothetical protein [unclassified Kitasatospora]|uniref:hypothetical protein n=1 Tax=unclassified Kitasatospora TaxID=2633591 RepID=UPI0033D08A54